MNDRDWRAIIGGTSHDIVEKFAGLADCELFYIHADERGLAVTLGFDVLAEPGLVSQIGGEDWHNAIKFYVELGAARSIAIRGWSYIPATSFCMRELSDDLYAAHIAGDGFTIDVSCAGCRRRRPVVRTRRGVTRDG
jgi:hypothetical protein